MYVILSYETKVEISVVLQVALPGLCNLIVWAIVISSFRIHTHCFSEKYPFHYFISNTQLTLMISIPKNHCRILWFAELLIFDFVIICDNIEFVVINIFAFLVLLVFLEFY